MNKFDKVVRDGKIARLNKLALQIEGLLKEAGDLAEEIGTASHNVGYVYISNLDAGQLTAFAVGDARRLSAAIRESCARNEALEAVIMDAALTIAEAS